MHENEEDLKRKSINEMVFSAKLELASDNQFKNMTLKEQLEMEVEREELAKCYAQKTVTMYNERLQLIPSKEAFALKYPEDYQRLGKLRRSSFLHINSVEGKEYTLLCQKEKKFLKEYFIDKKKRGLPLNEYEEGNLKHMLTWEEYRAIFG
jgi:hypothetical protein